MIKQRLLLTIMVMPIMLLAKGGNDTCCAKTSLKRCTGSSNCTACSNCSACKYCIEGRACSVCAYRKRSNQVYKGAAPQSAPTRKAVNAGQCQAITKRGTRCSRSARSGGYCWQHGG